MQLIIQLRGYKAPLNNNNNNIIINNNITIFYNKIFFLCDLCAALCGLVRPHPFVRLCAVPLCVALVRFLCVPHKALVRGLCAQALCVGSL